MAHQTKKKHIVRKGFRYAKTVKITKETKK